MPTNLMEIIDRMMNDPRPEPRPCLQIAPPYKDGEDIEDFLEIFKNMM